MRIIVDTNVFVAAIFWSGYPSQIIDAWLNHKVQLVVTTEIIQEYERITETLAKQYDSDGWKDLLESISSRSEIHVSKKLHHKVSRDPNDDMFIECALSAKVKIIVSGDKDLLTISGYQNIEVIKPAEFVKKYL